MKIYKAIRLVLLLPFLLIYVPVFILIGLLIEESWSEMLRGIKEIFWRTEFKSITKVKPYYQMHSGTQEFDGKDYFTATPLI